MGNVQPATAIATAPIAIALHVARMRNLVSPDRSRKTAYMQRLAVFLLEKTEL
jgi:hypothetical protein